MYSELDDEQKSRTLTMSGAELYSECCGLFKAGKMSAEKLRQTMAFWLNQHNTVHYDEIVKILTNPHKDTGQTVWFVNNLSERKDTWEKYDYSQERYNSEEEKSKRDRAKANEKLYKPTNFISK
jgi:hypothetical protein